MKVLFIIPYLNIARHTLPNSLRKFSPPEIPHNGVAALTIFLQQNKVEIKVVDERLGYSFKEILKQIQDFSPDLIGITMTSFCSKKVNMLVKWLKEHISIPILLGGAHISVMRKEALDYNDADFAIKHEGEYAILELLDAIKSNKGFEEIRGLIWRKDGKIIENPDREPIKDIDELPFPDYDSFELDKYYAWQNKIIPILTSRGCPFRCVFCSAGVVMGSRIRMRSPANVLEEIEYWYKKGIRTFDINDEIFTCNPKRVDEICDLIIKRGLKIKFRCYNGIRVDTVTQDLLKKMRDAGCTDIAFGVETGNEQIMKNIKKGITLEQARKAIGWAKSLGIRVRANFIVGHPGETMETAMDTLRFANEVGADEINFNNLVPYPGTELFGWVKANGKFIIPPEKYMNDLSSYKIRDPVFETKEFSAEERRKMIKLMTLATRRKYLESRLRKPATNIAFFISRTDLGYRVLETLRKSNVYTKLFRKSLIKVEVPK